MPATTDHPASSRLILCEKSGQWAAWLKRMAGAEARWIVEARSLPQLRRELAEHRASLCGIEATLGNVIQAAKAIAELRDEFPRSSVIVLCQEDDTPFEPVLREAGAVAIITSPRQVDPVISLWQRHCRLHVPREETLMDRILARLNW